MTRFTKDITLIACAYVQTENGSFVEQQVRKNTFANRFTTGASGYLAAAQSGLHADSEVQIRTEEYDGQLLAEMDGIEYTVERASDTGEFTTLTLAKKVRND